MESMLLILKFSVITGSTSANFFQICDKFIGKNDYAFIEDPQLLLFTLQLLHK
jgi:hypothetical protein